LSLEIATGGAANNCRPTVFQRHIAIERVHRALPRCNYVGMAWDQAETSSGAVVKQHAGPFSYQAGTEGIRQVVNPRNTVAFPVRDYDSPDVAEVAIPTNPPRSRGRTGSQPFVGQ
jgi:hypothetical protein